MGAEKKITCRYEIFIIYIICSLLYCVNGPLIEYFSETKFILWKKKLADLKYVIFLPFFYIWVSYLYIFPNPNHSLEKKRMKSFPYQSPGRNYFFTYFDLKKTNPSRGKIFREISRQRRRYLDLTRIFFLIPFSIFQGKSYPTFYPGGGCGG